MTRPVQILPADAEAAADPDGPTVTFAAFGCGVLVAAIYYAQPLIDPISESIGLPRATAGLIVTMMQVGYGLGLALIVPLADRVENRALVSLSFLCTAAAQIALSFATGAGGFLAAALFAGISCVGAQVLVPMIAGMASHHRRGRVIGAVMAGLLTGIMLARPASSFAASLMGWRWTFRAAAALTLLAGLLLRFRLPRHHPAGARMSYLAALRSTLGVVARYPLLRRRTAYQMALFGLFAGFWTTVPLLLADRFGFGQSRIALFALAGAGGALAAPLAGRLADRGHARRATILAGVGVAALLALSLPLVWWGAVLGLALGAMLFDALVQTNQVVTQRIIFALSDAERARINSAYMTSIFLAGAVISAFGPFLYARWGWGAISVAGVALALPIALAEAFLPPRAA